MKLPKFSRFTKISLVVAGVLLAAWLGLTLFAENVSTRTAASIDRPDTCPNCGRKVTDESMQRNLCPYCLMQNAGDPERAKIRKDSSGVAWGRSIARILIGSVIVLLLANVGVAVYTRQKQRKEEFLFYYNCPKCSRKLRYRESQIGRLAKCPLCERPIVFPRPTDMPETRWTRLRRMLHLPSARAGRNA
jgi:DNA-directed RNA polymerase subunit RPC12/RpoP